MKPTKKRIILQRCLKLILLLCLLLLCCVATSLLSAREPFRTALAEVTHSTDYLSGYNQGASEIIPVIERVQEKDACTKLIVGDSVCFRLFSELQEKNPRYCIAGTNRGVTMSGQYILVHEFLENHPNATDVYLCVIEDSLITTYETGYGYQYGVMPFAETGTLSLLDDETLRAMGRTYGSLFILPEVVNLIEASPMNKKLYYNLLESCNPTYSDYSFPEVSNRYIEKMYLLCEARGVQLHLVAEPLKDIPERHAIEKTLREAFEGTAIQQYFPHYFDQITYYPPAYFSDNVHPTGSRELQNEMIRQMQKMSGCMEDLILE